MRNSRSSGPPSTLSGSSSGRGLVAGSHIGRVPPPSVFVPGDQGKTGSRSRTKVIVILGIALPVLACIIGVAAWAVTTDVLRINPRPHDNPYNRYGHQGKTRIDTFQNRNDQDIDVFQLNSISSKVSTVPSIIMKAITQKGSSKPTSSPTQIFVETVTVQSTSEKPKVSDIISRLISDMPIPKNPKHFVVFAPVAEEPNDAPKGRRFDGKVVVHDGDDLMAEESVVSEEFSKENFHENVPSSRTRKSSRENSAYKYAEPKSPDDKQNLRMRGNRKPHAMYDKSETGHYTSSSKRHLQNEQTSITSEKNLISNRNGGISQPMANVQQYNKDIADNLHSQYPSQNQMNSAQIPLGNAIQKQSINVYRNAPQNLPHINIQQQHQPQIHELQRMPSQSQPPSGLPPGRQLFHKPPPILGEPPQSTGLSSSTNDHHSSSSSQHRPHDYGPPHSQGNPPFHHPIGPVYHSIPPPPPQNPPLPNPPSSSFTNNKLQPPASSFQADLSNGPQYFAPPPQTFHTKTSYDLPPPKTPGSSLASYERVAQSSVDHSKDAVHHHHHHHHHEPIQSNSDQIGDVNLSDVPRTNDADRFGSIGVGLGPSPRGITVQIGGGGGGGGLGGLLPLGALGIAKNIVASLLPRPSLGLNSKVYLGLEVGRGGGGLLG